MGYSIKQKIDICLMAESNPDMTQQDLAHWAKVRYGSTRPPSQTTISRILAKKDEFIALKEHEFKLIRRRRLSNPLLRKVLLEWISQNVWNNIPISPPIVLSSAGNLWKLLPENLREGSGEFSYRWCSQFLSKVNIQLNNVENELYNRLKVWNSDEKTEIRQLLSGFDPRKIFTLSEVCISHDLPLDKSFYADTSDFLTCMLCVNIDGTEKLDPLIIGRYEDYPSFDGKSSARISAAHGVSYHSNRKKWLTSTLFYDWLSVLDKRLALANRDIVLILENSAPHRIINIKLERIRLLYTSETPSFLPMTWGIENDFRINFRLEQYKDLITKQREFGMQTLTKEQQTFNMIQLFDLIKKAWSLVPETHIQSAWKKSGILPETVTKNFQKQSLFDNKLESELLNLIDGFNVIEKWDVLSLLDLTVEQKVSKAFLSNDEIVQSSIVESYNDVSHSSDDNQRAPFSHELGKPLARLQKLGERLNSTNSDVMDFDPFGFYTDNGKFDAYGNDGNDNDMSYNGNFDTSSTFPNVKAFSNALQPMSELAISNGDLNNDFFNSDLIKDEFMEVELPWSNLFRNGQETPGSTSISSIPAINTDTAFIPSDPNLIFDSQNSTNNLYNNGNEGLNYNIYANLITSQKLSIINNFLNLIENDDTLKVSESTIQEIRILQSSLSQLY